MRTEKTAFWESAWCVLLSRYYSSDSNWGGRDGCTWQAYRRRQMHAEFWRGNLKWPLGIDVRIVLKWILKETGWDSVGWMYLCVYTLYHLLNAVVALSKYCPFEANTMMELKSVNNTSYNNVI